MEAYVRLSRSVTVLLFGSILASCGGGSGGGPSIPAAAMGSPAPTPQTNPNVSRSDTAADWSSSRYDPSGSGDNALQTAITEQNVSSIRPSWIFHGTVGSLSSVAVLNGIVYRTEEGGNTYAVSEATGSQVWNYAPIGSRGIQCLAYRCRRQRVFPKHYGCFLCRFQWLGAIRIQLSSVLGVGAAYRRHRAARALSGSSGLRERHALYWGFQPRRTQQLYAGRTDLSV